jgi:hypothetical protein
MLNELSSKGRISPTGKEVGEVMDALHDFDGGVYRGK